ncbi:hypothetical protein B0H13DRAFT_2233605 [Mycena leptocephala]|nr:hypothetical protein B0H13DRAFT_2233605 [Mycena leptocephala]
MFEKKQNQAGQTQRQHLRYPRSLSRTAALRADPWPLPHTPEHLASTASSDSENPPLPPLPRPNESVSTLRARLVYQSRKRGTLESDLILSTFAREHLGGMSEAELREYDKLKIHARNEGKVVRRMPPLP